MTVFWEHGYEGASLTSLTEAMGIGRKSMYAAFGNKEDLFRAALERYAEGPGGYVVNALGAPTAHGVAEAFLAGAARSTTMPDRPAGCLGVQGALATGETGRPAREALIEWRSGGQALLNRRFRRAVEEGDLPPDADCELLARFVMTVANGIAVQAASGASLRDLERVIKMAMRSWPPS